MNKETTKDPNANQEIKTKLPQSGDMPDDLTNVKVTDVNENESGESLTESSRL